MVQLRATGEVILRLSVTMMVLLSIVIILRLVAKKINRNYGIEDALIVVAARE